MRRRSSTSGPGTSSRKTHRLLVDSRVLAPAEEKLSAEEEARRERQRIAALRGIVDYQWSPDSRGLLVPLSGDLYYYDLSKPAGEAVRRLTETAAFETDPKFSPRGRYVSFIRDQDLYAVEVATGAERRLTTGGGGLVSHGVAEFIAQEEMGRDTGYWWSPDEKHLAYTRVDESPVDEVERFEIDAGGVRVLKQRYPATGRPNAGVTLAILALDTGASAGVRPRQQGRLPRARRVVPGGRPPAGAVAGARPEAARRPLLPRHRRRVAPALLGAQRHLGGAERRPLLPAGTARDPLGLAAQRPQPPVPATTTAAC